MENKKEEKIDYEHVFHSFIVIFKNIKCQPKARQGLDIRTLFQHAETRKRDIEGQQNDNNVIIID